MDAVDISGASHLLNTCRRDFVSDDELVKLFLQYGANVNNADEEGQTPLMAACFKGHLEQVKAIIDRGAKINMTDDQNRSALFLASGFGFTDVVEYLLQSQAEVNSVDCRSRSLAQ